jgi:hypothetical protein
MLFCQLDGDEKTFNLVKRYIEFLNIEKKTSPQELDKLIQIEEIRTHLYLNGRPQSDSTEIQEWIKKYGKPFRTYLNTIKLVYLLWVCGQNKSWSDITFDDYKRICAQINGASCVLDSLHE